MSDLLKQLTQQQHLKLYQDQIKQQLYPQSQALHLLWLMKQFPDIERMINKKTIWVSGIDSWLLYNMTGMQHVATDYSTAMTTYLFDPKTLNWSSFMLEEFELPKQVFPTCHPSFHHYGNTKAFIPYLMIFRLHRLLLITHHAGIIPFQLFIWRY